MAVEIKMPQLSDTMSSGKILTWHKREGDTIARGDILAEVETDKANLEIESFHKGVLLKILTPAEQTAKVGEVIAMIGEAGEKVTAPSSTPAAQPTANGSSEVTGQSVPATAAPTSSPVAPAPRSTPTWQSADDSGRVKASPLAKKIAAQHNVDLRSLSGSGPNGRIVRRDVEAASQQGRSGAPTAPAPSAAPSYQQPQARESRATGGSVSGRLTPLSRMRETIARRMQESVTQSPHFYTTAVVDMDQAVRLREHLKGREEYKGISINHLVMKAVAYALAHEPRVNRTMRDGQMFEPDEINLGIITAVDDGLIIPVIREADKLSLRDLVFEARAAVERARAGRPNSADLMGGTFSISNMGMFDIESFTAIINPGQGAVLAVGAVREEPVVRNQQVVPGKVMRATLSVDHRVIDGVMAANFVKHFKEALELPALLM